MSKLNRVKRIGRFCDRERISTREGMERSAEIEYRLGKAGKRRREFLANMGTVAAVGALASAGPGRWALAAPQAPDISVAIVGAGMAGLACADTLRVAGLDATVYEARDRVGGRVHSLGGQFPGSVEFPGQVIERGGEALNTTHQTMKGYAQEMGLVLEDLNKEWLPGETAWYLNGGPVAESVLVDEYRDMVAAMRSDLKKLSNEVTVDSFSDFDESMDNTNLEDYLESRDAASNILAAIDVVYTTEYGRELIEQSALNFLFYIHLDKRSSFTPLGVFSDERFHIIGGNQQVPTALSERLNEPVIFGAELTAVRKLGSGQIELTLDKGGTHAYDAVILTIPFSVLRDVELDGSLGIPGDKVSAINNMVYGNNAKLHVGFDGPFWGELNGTGVSYSDLPNHQLTWEVNPTNASANNTVLVDYSGGERGANLNPNKTNLETEMFLGDLDTVYPGAFDAAIRTKTHPKEEFLSDLKHWPSDPLNKGSYVSNHPGYFTTIAGIEGMPVDNLYFAGEHTDSFYEWQGYMEGAANSGIRAAGEIMSDFKVHGGGNK
jgi:monoamine oxidase